MNTDLFQWFEVECTEIERDGSAPTCCPNPACAADLPRLSKPWPGARCGYCDTLVDGTVGAPPARGRVEAWDRTVDRLLVQLMRNPNDGAEMRRRAYDVGKGALGLSDVLSPGVRNAAAVLLESSGGDRSVAFIEGAARGFARIIGRGALIDLPRQDSVEKMPAAPGSSDGIK